MNQGSRTQASKYSQVLGYHSEQYTNTHEQRTHHPAAANIHELSTTALNSLEHAMVKQASMHYDELSVDRHMLADVDREANDS